MLSLSTAAFSVAIVQGGLQHVGIRAEALISNEPSTLDLLPATASLPNIAYCCTDLGLLLFTCLKE